MAYFSHRLKIFKGIENFSRLRKFITYYLNLVTNYDRALKEEIQKEEVTESHRTIEPNVQAALTTVLNRREV